MLVTPYLLAGLLCISLGCVLGVEKLPTWGTNTGELNIAIVTIISAGNYWYRNYTEYDTGHIQGLS